MDEFLKMDVFFAVTTGAIVIVTAFFAVLLFRLIRILKHVEAVAEMVEDEGRQLRADIARARERVKDGGARVLHLLDLFSFARPKRRTRKSAPETTESADESI